MALWNSDITSKDHLARVRKWSQEWREYGLSTAPADFDRATKAVFDAYKLVFDEYKFALLIRKDFPSQEPKVVLRMGSPLGAVLGGLTALSLHNSGVHPSSIEGLVEQKIPPLIKQSRGINVGDQIKFLLKDLDLHHNDSPKPWIADFNPTSMRPRSMMPRSVWLRSFMPRFFRPQSIIERFYAITAQPLIEGDSIELDCGYFADSVMQEIDSQVGYRMTGDIWGGAVEAPGFGWFVSFVHNTCGLDGLILKQFKIFEALYQTCWCVWWGGNVVAISDRPIEIHCDDVGELHHENGPSIVFRDGWQLHHRHGVSVKRN